MDFNAFCNYINNIINTSKDYIDVEEFLKIIESLNIDLSLKNELLMKVHYYDYKMTKKELDEIIELKKIDDSNNLEFSNITLKIPTPKQVIANQSKIINNKIDIKNYINMIDNFSDMDDFTYLSETINKDDFFDTINSLLAYYTLELVTLKKLEYEENTLFEEEKSKINNIIDNLHYLQICTQEDNVYEENKLIYLTTMYGNNVFVNSLEKISNEYYDSILNAFDSLKNGSFKNNKRIGKNDDGFDSPLYQVRDNQIRIFYLKISPNLYLVADVIVKKYAVRNSYSHYIRQLSKSALSQIKQFLMLQPSQQEKIINDNMNVTSSINSILIDKKKVLK